MEYTQKDLKELNERYNMTFEVREDELILTKSHVNGVNISIPEGVSIIAAHAFAGGDVRNITLSDTVKTIKAHAFNGSSVNVLNISKSLVTIEKNAFHNTPHLNEINVDPANDKFAKLENILYNKETMEGLYIETKQDVDILSFPTNLKSFAVENIKECYPLNRIKTIILPTYIEGIVGSDFLPFSVLKKIEINEQHELYTTVDGILYGEGMSQLICIPPCHEMDIYKIPNTIEYIGSCAINSAEIEEIDFSEASKEITLEKKAITLCGNIKIQLGENQVQLVPTTIEDGIYISGNCQLLTKIKPFNISCYFSLKVEKEIYKENVNILASGDDFKDDIMPSLIQYINEYPNYLESMKEIKERNEREYRAEQEKREQTLRAREESDRRYKESIAKRDAQREADRKAGIKKYYCKTCNDREVDMPDEDCIFCEKYSYR